MHNLRKLRLGRVLAELRKLRYPLAMANTAPTAPSAGLDPGGGRASIVLVTQQAVTSHLLPPGATLVIGRGSEAGVQVDAPGVSRLHACIENSNGQVSVRDLGSTNGTLINGRQVRESAGAQRLKVSDLVELGDVILMYRDPMIAAGGQTHYEMAIRTGTEIISTGAWLMLVGEVGAGKAHAATRMARNAGRSALSFDCGSLEARDFERLASAGEELVLLRGVDALRPATYDVLEALFGRNHPQVITTSRSDFTGTAESRHLSHDLVAAMSVNQVLIPPLRSDRLRINLLCDEVFNELEGVDGHEVHLAPAARAALWSHSWRGNVPELLGVLRAAAMRSDASGLVGPSDLDLGPEARDAAEKLRIEQTLKACAGNQTKSAQRLGISRRTLVSRLDKYGISRPRKGR